MSRQYGKRRGNQNRDRRQSGPVGGRKPPTGGTDRFAGCHAPYGFVPLSKRVFFPVWPERTTHDIPLENGYCGWLDIRVTAESPIMVGDEASAQDGQNRRVFHQLTNGTYAIPGSTLEGAIRNQLEIATFGKFFRVDDVRHSVRDLTPGARYFYGSRFTTMIDGRVRSLSKGGWLRFQKGRWLLFPCSYARIDHSLINAHFRNNVCTGKEQTAEDKYRKLGAKENVRVRFGAKFHIHPKPNFSLEYDRAWFDEGDGQEGFLVFTGQPRPPEKEQSSRKHMEFIFSPPEGEPYVVNERVMQQFLEIYSEKSLWKLLVSRENPHQTGIPVFWLEGEDRKPDSLGLSQLFRLPYEYSVHDLIANVSEDHLSDRPDFCDTLFGTPVGGGVGKGRVSFGTAELLGQPTWDENHRFYGALGSPKSSFYPHYVKQKVDSGDKRKVESSVHTGRNGKQYKRYHYVSYVPAQSGSPLQGVKPEVAGWKWYPAREKLVVPEPPDNESVGVRFIPMVRGSQFRARIRLHNVRPEEIGALAWGLEWGGDEHMRHSIGMAKAFGYGQVAIKITGLKLRPNRISEVEINNIADVRGKGFRGRFVDLVNQWSEAELGLPWAHTDQLRTLSAMASPANAAKAAGDGNKGHMTLRNFFNAKRFGFHLEPFPMTPVNKKVDPAAE